MNLVPAPDVGVEPVVPSKRTAPSLTVNLAAGLLVPTPTLPVAPMTVKAETEVVAVPATVVVAKYRLPPAFLKAH